MARQGTIKYAKENLTPEEFAAWESMPVKLSKKQLQAGERPTVGEAKPPAVCAEDGCEKTIPGGVQGMAHCKEHAHQPEDDVEQTATPEQVAQAREEYAEEGDISIDDDAPIIVSEGEVWVQAWVLLHDDEEED